MTLKEYLKEGFILPTNTNLEDNTLLYKLALLKKLDKKDYQKKLYDLNYVRKSEGLKELTDDDIKKYTSLKTMFFDDKGETNRIMNLDKKEPENTVKEKRFTKTLKEQSIYGRK